MSNETIDNLLNFNEVFQSKLRDIKKAFISFYGAEKAEFIDERLSSVLAVGYLEPSNLSSMLNTVKNNINEELVQKFFVVSGIEDNEKNRKKYMSCNISNEFSTPIGTFNHFIKMKETEPGYNSFKGYANTFTTNCYGRFYEDLDDAEKDQLKRLSIIYEELVVEYNKKIEKYKPYIDYLETCEKINEEVKKKYFIKFIEKYDYLLNDDERKKFEEFKNNENIKNIFLSSPYFCSINVSGKIENFTDENQEKLNNDSTSISYKIVKDGQIKFFSNLGIELDDDFMNDPNYKTNIAKLNELANDMAKTRQKMEKEYMIEYYASLPEFQANKKRVNSVDFYCKDQLLSGSSYMDKATCIVPNIVNKDGKMEVAPILLFACGYIGDYSDARIIHELNHAYELSIKDVSSEKAELLCGWDYVTCYVDEREYDFDDHKNREYELFNEIINELISQEITTIMHEQGNYIINNEQDAKIKGATSYEHSSFIIRDFFNIYKKEIIESRKNGNIDVIINTVGKENFDAMNKLFFDFNKNFSGNNYYRLVNQLRANMDTDETRLYYQLSNQRDVILNKMKEFKQDGKIVA